MKQPGLYRPGVDFFFIVHDIDDLLSLVVVERPLGYKQRRMRPANRCTNANEESGRQKLIVIPKNASQPERAGLGVELVIDKVDRSLMRKTLLIRQGQSHRQSAVASRVGFTLAD